LKCAHCREDITGEAIAYKGKSYCCQACAFEASVRLGSMCGSRSTVEAGLRYERSHSAPDTGTSGSKICLVIAIDGPVAVGKSSVGRLLAQRLGYQFVDTGAMYRALTWKALQAGINPEDEAKLTALAARTDIKLMPSERKRNGYRVLVDEADATEEVRSPDVEAAVSVVSRIPAVRRQMVEKQRQLARKGGVVMVGRDIATVVLPRADLKVFLTASPEERAQRRFRELKDAGKTADFEFVLRELKSRDNLDSTRRDSPLKPDADSKAIDTDKISLDEVVDRVYKLAQEGKCL